MQKKLMIKFITIYDFKSPLQKVSLKKTWLNIIKAVHDKSTVNIILSGENRRHFLRDHEKYQDAHFYHFNSAWFWKFWPQEMEKKNK